MAGFARWGTGFVSWGAIKAFFYTEKDRGYECFRFRGKCIENVQRKGLHGPCGSVGQQLQREAA